MAVAMGILFTVAVDEHGHVFSFGYSEEGELGTGKVKSKTPTPTQVPGLPAPVRQVAARQNHTAIVTDAGDLFMCGRGDYGRLGLGDEADRATPTLVARAVFDGEAVLMVACGDSHTAAVTEGGGVYTFGSGQYGHLGHGDEEDQLAPRRVPAAGFNGERVVMVAAGGAHTVALTEAGHVFTWGWGEDGQLGHDDREQHLAPRQVEAGRFGGEKVVFVAAGGDHTVAVTAGGALYTWGYGLSGRLGHGDTGNRLVPTVVGAGAFGGSAVVMAACGEAHTLVVTHDGALWACGAGNYGQLGLADSHESHVFMRVRSGVISAAAGFMQSAAVTQDGELCTWGLNGCGQLGHGDENNRSIPTRIESAFKGARIGRCLPLSENQSLALAMGVHSRLGQESPLNALGVEPGLLEMIEMATRDDMRGTTKRNESLNRLTGGGIMPRLS